MSSPLNLLSCNDCSLVMFKEWAVELAVKYPMKAVYTRWRGTTERFDDPRKQDGWTRDDELEQRTGKDKLGEVSSDYWQKRLSRRAVNFGGPSICKYIYF